MNAFLAHWHDVKHDTIRLHTPMPPIPDPTPPTTPGHDPISPPGPDVVPGTPQPEIEPGTPEPEIVPPRDPVGNPPAIQ